MAPKQSYVAGSLSSSRVRVNPIVTKFVQRNAKSKVTYDVQPESNENLKFSKLKKEEKHAFRERLSKLQVRKFAKPRMVNWDVFTDYECEDELRKMMRMSYVYPGDADTFKDYSWERAFSIYENVFREWSLEFFSTFYFERKVVDLMRETCIWFRLCGKEHAYTLPGFAVDLGLYEQDEIEHRLFEAHFLSLVRYHNDYERIPEYWNRVGDPSCSRRNSSKLRNPLMKFFAEINSLGVLHRTGSQDKCNQPDLWVMKLLEEDKNGNAAWIIAEYLSRRAPGIKDRSDICGGHYVTPLARNLGYFENEELVKCSEPMESETWDDKSFGKALNQNSRMLGAWNEPTMAAPQAAPQPPYNPPNVPPYPFQYDPYPGQYPYPYPGYTPFPEPVPVYGRVPDVGGSSYDVGGSSSGVGKKRQKVFTFFDEEENYEDGDDEESEDERIHTPDDMEDDDE